MPHRNSRLIFWLLLAATLCVDAVVLFWTTQSETNDFSSTLFLSLAYGQLSALCVWAIVSHRTVGLRWMVPFAAGTAIGLFVADAGRTDSADKWDDNVAIIGLFWVHVVVAIVALWLLKPICLLRNGEASLENGAWRFSTKNLMVLMTVSAILLALLGRNRLLSEAWSLVLPLAVGNVAVLLVVIGTHRADMHRLLRLAAVCAAALMVGATWEWSGFSIGAISNWMAYYVIQALVVWAWLEVLTYETSPRSADGAHSSAAAEQPTN